MASGAHRLLPENLIVVILLKKLLNAEFSRYTPMIPLTMKFPTSDFCGDNDDRLLMVGNAPEDDTELPEIVFATDEDENGTVNEAFHVKLDVLKKYVERWGVVGGVVTPRVGQAGDGTTIDFDEPFLVK